MSVRLISFVQSVSRGEKLGCDAVSYCATARLFRQMIKSGAAALTVEFWEHLLHSLHLRSA
jgi:hypothetical protein